MSGIFLHDFQLVLETRSSTEPRVHLGKISCPTLQGSSCLCLFNTKIIGIGCCIILFVDIRDLNFGPHACMVNTLLTEPSLLIENS